VPRSELRFAEPVADPEDLKRIIESLCEKLCLDLETRGIGARRLDLVFVRVDNITQAARIGLSRPYREPKYLARLLADRLVVIDPGFGIELASLTASWVEALAERQTVGRHVTEDGSQVDVSQLVDTLALRLGHENVFRLAPVESGLPERSVRRIPALGPTKGLDWPKHLPRPAPFCASGKGGSCRGIARSSAAPVHLAQHPSPGREGRWPVRCRRIPTRAPERLGAFHNPG
jgi:protein ImuB